MKKVLFCLLLFFICLCNVNALDFPIDINSSNAFVGSLDEEAIMYGHNENESISIASLTKLMTIYVTYENVENIDQFVSVTYDDISNLDGLAIYGLQVGDNYSYRDLMYCSYIISGADCAKTLANHVFDSYDSFLSKMNDYAKEYNLSNTKFIDVTGIDENNKSSMYDLYNLVYIMFHKDDLMKLLNSSNYTLSNEDVIRNNIYNRFDYSSSKYIKGCKVGYTDLAGYLLLSIANVSGRDYLIITRSNDDSFISDTSNILNSIYSGYYKKYVLFKKDEELRRIEVLDGTASEYIVFNEKDVSVILNDYEYSKLKIDYHITNVIDPSYKKGDSLGYYNIMIGDEILSRHEIILDSDVGFIKKDSKVLIIIVSIVVIILMLLISTNVIKIKKFKK